MLVSTPTKPYHPDSSPRAACVPASPTYSRYTPPQPSQYDSPMFSTSPFRPHPLFSRTSSPFSSEHHSTAQAHFTNPFHMSQPQPIDDEDGAIFLSPRQPLLTPSKAEHRIALATRTNTDARAGAGTKRKSTPLATPLRPNTLTPLKITQSAAFDRLAPLPAPKFNTRTPQTKGETDVYLTRQTATLTRLRLSDRHGSDGEDEFCGPANDSGCELDEDDTGHGLFLSNRSHHPSGKQITPLKALAFHAPHVKGKGKEEEVAEAVSPGGHITKRRARSRPVSSDLLELSFKAPQSPTKQSGIPGRVGATRPRHSGPVTFPSTAHRGKMSPGSASSSSEAGSPRPRRRISGGSTVSRSYNTGHGLFPPRPPLSRIDSVSAASLFFGPTIPQKKHKNDENMGPQTRARTTSSRGPEVGLTPGLRQINLFRPHLANRHSYAGPEDRNFDLNLWNTARNESPSPESSPFAPAVETPSRRGSLDMDDDEDMFFAGETSFEMNVTQHSPSPTAKLPLPMKYKRREYSDEDDLPSTGSSLGADGSHVMPKASMSVSSFCSEEGLMTPGVAPEGSSGWPSTSIYVSDTNETTTHPYGSQGVDVDAFIMKTLAAASSKGSSMPKKAPGTPVKKARPVFFGNDRPWQSAVASKVGLKDDSEYMKKAAAPRKSMPAAFGAFGAGLKAPLAYDRQNQDKNQGTETDDEEEYSPSMRRDKYVGLGLGQPGAGSLKNGAGNNAPLMSRKSWLLRRSSSGAFSSGSDSASLSSTPTRVKGIDWQLPIPKIPAVDGDAGMTKDAKSFTRSTSGSSSSSVATLHSPTTERKRPGFADSGAVVSVTKSSTGRHNAPRMSAHHAPMRFSEGFAEDAQAGRFERDFEEIEEVGSGEFGKVIKAQCKTGDDHGVYAIKKSKRFEGVKHRLRLREEVDILKHLSQASLTRYEDGRHPNVLAYVDSWEEDEALFIQTELCESGNLARFLWEYGRVFPRLDEARVWKIIVDLSNGLRFIHDSGVIHLDLKPSNVFLTKEGGFKIGDFGMASLWPRPIATASASGSETSAIGPACTKAVEGGSSAGFEREGDKLYLAPEVLQGRYSKAADIFSFGMTMLEVAANVVVPDQGDGWQRLRHEDFSQVDLDDSPELLALIYRMMRTDPTQRMSIEEVWSHPVVTRARQRMDTLRDELVGRGESTWLASPLAKVPTGFLEDILGREDGAMDTSM